MACIFSIHTLHAWSASPRLVSPPRLKPRPPIKPPPNKPPPPGRRCDANAVRACLTISWCYIKAKLIVTTKKLNSHEQDYESLRPSSGAAGRPIRAPTTRDPTAEQSTLYTCLAYCTVYTGPPTCRMRVQLRSSTDTINVPDDFNCYKAFDLIVSDVFDSDYSTPLKLTQQQRNGCWPKSLGGLRSLDVSFDITPSYINMMSDEATASFMYNYLPLFKLTNHISGGSLLSVLIDLGAVADRNSCTYVASVTFSPSTCLLAKKGFGVSNKLMRCSQISMAPDSPEDPCRDPSYGCNILPPPPPPPPPPPLGGFPPPRRQAYIGQLVVRYWFVCYVIFLSFRCLRAHICAYICQARCPL